MPAGGGYRYSDAEHSLGDKTVMIWDVERLKLIGESLKGHSGDVSDIAFGPDGKRLAIDFQIINFTRKQGGDRTGRTSPTDDAVKLFF